MGSSLFWGPLVRELPIITAQEHSSYDLRYAPSLQGFGVSGNPTP